MSFMYYGGKSKIADKIISYFPAHTLYVEVFGGSAEILFRKKPAKAEVYNDLDDGLCAIFQCLYEPKLKKELIEMLETFPPSRTFLEHLVKDNPKEIVRKAFRKLYLLRYSFNANCENFAAFQAIDYNSPRLKGFDFKVLENISKRKIIIENQDFRKLLPRFDKKHSLIYLDPPYYDIRQRYEYSFEEQDHLDLLEIINSLEQATWILSYNNHLTIREWYKNYHIIEESWRYSFNFTFKIRNDSGIRTELLISNKPFKQWNIYNSYNQSLTDFLSLEQEEEVKQT